MPLVLKELASSETRNRRNAAFCAGEICRNGGAVALKYPSSKNHFNQIFHQYCQCPCPANMFTFIKSGYYADILCALYPLFGKSEPDYAVRDNAVGAIARMIMVQPQAIPLNQV